MLQEKLKLNFCSQILVVHAVAKDHLQVFVKKIPKFVAFFIKIDFTNVCKL